MRSERPEWGASRIRALANSAPPATAAPEIAVWLRAHQDDQALRERLVDLWVRSGRPDRALDLLGPLLAGATSDRWKHREAELARAAAQPARAIATLEDLSARGRTTPAEWRALAELQLDAHEYLRARRAVDQIAASSQGCDDSLFQLLDRLPDPAGMEMMINAVQTRDCTERPQWMVRALQRAVAAARHTDALELMAKLPARTAQEIEMQRLKGQLLLWTGDAAQAVVVLAPVLEYTPGDVDARMAMVDAYRAIRRPYRAWEVGERLLSLPTLDAERLTTLAAVALEADRPGHVAAIVDRLPTDAETQPMRVGLLGRALLALGRPADAEAMLAAVDLARLSPEAIRAATESAIALRGRHAVTTRGDGGDNPFADVESALLREQPGEALTALAHLSTLQHQERWLDLQATALTGTGDVAAALVVTAHLRESRPAFAPYAIREVELHWQLGRTPETLKDVLDLAVRFPGNQQAAIAAARVLASEERHDEALSALGDRARWVALPVDGRMLAARSLHATKQSQAALDLVADLDLVSGSQGLFLAQLMAEVRGPAAAAETFHALATRSDATAALYLAWAGLTVEPAAHVAILEDATVRFPRDVATLRALASARSAAGNSEGARQAAEEMLAQNPHDGDAWHVLIEAIAAARPRAELGAALDRFEVDAANSPPLLVAMADRVAGLARSPTDPILTRALRWLDSMPAVDRAASSGDMARVRLLAAAERWDAAIGAANATLEAGPLAPMLRLRADVLSWSGRHAEAIRAYDAYLRQVPDDLGARRQQARVAGWAGLVGDARRMYTRVARRVTG